MKLKFETMYRTVLMACALLLIWSVWRSTAAEGGATQSPAAASVTNAASQASDAALDAVRQPLPTPQWIENLASRPAVPEMAVVGQ